MCGGKSRSLSEPPVFEWHSQIPRVNEGKTAVLECHARGTPTPTIVWKREDDEDIRINSSLYVKSYKGSILSLYEASPRTAGAYVCVATNGHPPSVSRVLKLKVIHSPVVEFVAAEKHVWMRQGEIVNLSCRYAAYPHPQVVFHRENYFGMQNLSVNHFEIKRIFHQYPFTHTMSLTMTRITESDFGNYSCIVTNELGQAYDFLVLEEIPRTIARSTTTVSTTTTALRTRSTTPEIEGRAPIPLRDGSFTSSPNSSFLQNVPLRLTTPETLSVEYEVSKKHGDHPNSWSKKIARINISENSKSHTSTRDPGWKWTVTVILLNNIWTTFV